MVLIFLETYLLMETFAGVNQGNMRKLLKFKIKVNILKNHVEDILLSSAICLYVHSFVCNAQVTPLTQYGMKNLM